MFHWVRIKAREISVKNVTVMTFLHLSNKLQTREFDCQDIIWIICKMLVYVAFVTNEFGENLVSKRFTY